MLLNENIKLNQDLTEALTDLGKTKKKLTECKMELAKLREEYKVVQDKKNKIVFNAGMKIKKLQADLFEQQNKNGL